MDSLRLLRFKNRGEWREWLAEHHVQEQEAWVIHYKKGSRMQGVQHAEAVEEALCYGWIDGKLRSVDKESYALRYSPRRKNSVWSGINKETALRMIEQGLMKEAGMDRIAEAKRNGKWASAYSSKKRPSLPEDLKKALSVRKTTWGAFNKLSNSQQLQFIFWVDGAKKVETRRKRINIVVRIVQGGKKPGSRWWQLEPNE